MGLLAAIYAFLVWSRHGRTDMLAWGAVLLLPLLVALAFASRGYEVTDKTLTVRMVACLARYNLADLRRAEIASVSMSGLRTREIWRDSMQLLTKKLLERD